MSRISTNVVSMLAQRVLNTQNQGLTESLERLSTGLQINRGKDNPAGLIASESLRAEKAAISSAIKNGERAEQVVNVAEGGLQEINSLLVELQSLVGESANEAGISTEEKEANQSQIDSILQTIDRIANSTTFNGLKLLNGNFDYTTSNVDTSLISDLQINAARLSDTSGSFLDVTIDVTTSAQTGVAYFHLSGTSQLENDQNGSITLEITGNDGVQQFTFASGTSQADIVTAINTFSDSLGVSAAAESTSAIELQSTGYGSSQFVRVKVLEGDEGVDKLGSVAGTYGTNDQKDEGRDAVVLINGSQATTDGLKANIANTGFDVTIEIAATSSLNTNAGTASFEITGGGADFNLSPSVSLAGKISLGIETSTTGNLGNAVDGFLSALKSGGAGNVINGNLTQAQSIVDSAIKQVATQRGRLGSFQRNVVQSSINNLGVTLENVSAAESQIRDTDFAAETARLTRQQILGQAATQALAIANAQPQSVLALLG